ncbi:MAG: bifunctional (p)ppGpp synthetase/guanosine-3',5'-bis(diphosphate) 3'-pyrophosphohydrolase [Candidatus Eisenbacteria bacterium]|nr:bifunctional (p)ppGpp synthetase/guanosine-3',5'-bis(diphosphate) 3'-pyrophosphohydrolase [Candidatus Eisenbacteria bacterium]
MEDLAFKYLEPEHYRRIADLVSTKRVERERAIEEIRGPLRARLQEDGIEAEVSGRAKSFFSIWGKLRRSGSSFDDLNDLLGVRVVTDSKGDCYRVLGVVHDIYVPVADRFKDYIATPKSNMYQSLHTTVIGPQQRMVEIQIRTREMHLVSEIGIAAHYRYKEGGRWDEEIERKLGEVLVRRTTEWHDEAEDPKEFMDFLKISLYQDEVFVFTPKGELKQLPRGSTPLDFAYSIHSQVGNRCVGAKVNGRIVTLRHELKSGDTVEIMTSTQATPSEDWLQVAHSSRARAKIRQWLRAQRLQEAILLGREMLQKELRKKRKKFPTDEELMDVAQSFGLSDAALLYARMGEGNLAVPGVLQKLYPDLAVAKNPSPVERLREVVRLPVKGISIQSVSSLLVHIAQCCHPVPGDAVVGLVTRGRGVSVHRQDCPNTFDDRVEKERRIDVSWDVEGQKMFLVRLAVYGSDRANLLADVALAILSSGTNIREGGMQSADAQAVGDFLVEVRNLAHLERVMRAIRAVRGVSDVERKQHLPREFGEDTGRV